MKELHNDEYTGRVSERRGMNRLLDAAAANSLTTQVNNERHRGQDH